ncbi:MAG: DUF1963 domain-containing protein [Enterococcus avium]
MTIEEIKQVLGKKAISFSVGGFRPSFDASESWIGKVDLFHEEEDIPLDNEGLPMIPLMQLHLNNLLFVPASLEGVKLLTIFVSQNLPFDITSNGSNWVVREYQELSTIQKKEFPTYSDPLKPFPIKPTVIAEDFPIWDDSYNIPMTISNEILHLEREGVIEDYFETFDVHYEHKLSGYPTYCQSGIDFGEGFEFVLQIMSDEKVGFSIGDGGILFLAKNKETSEWRLYWDCY